MIRIALTILFIVIANKSLSAGDVANLAHYFRPFPVLLSLFFGCASLWCQIKRWQIILRYQGLPSRFGLAAKTLLLGILLAFVTPGRSGEFFRALALGRGNRADTVFAVIIDKMFIILATFVIGIACAVIQTIIIRVPLPRHVLLMSVTAAAVCAVVITFFALKRRSPAQGRVQRIFFRILNQSPKLLSRSGRHAVALSFAAQILLICQTVVLVRMFGCVSTRRTFIGIGQAYAFMAFMPIFIANIGIREYSFAVFLQNIGCACPPPLSMQGLSLGVSMGILVMNLIMPALAGLIWNIAGTPMHEFHSGIRYRG